MLVSSSYKIFSEETGKFGQKKIKPLRLIEIIE